MNIDLLLYTYFIVHSQSAHSSHTTQRSHTQMDGFVLQQTKINNDFTQLIKHDLFGFWTGKQLIRIE